jgi:predicted aldo/keto reductase-like oxidoreductase
MMNRREFLELAAASGLAVNAAMAAAVDARTGMPTRVLGRTGARVSILGFGCGSRFLMYDEEQALGITYVDTAFGYGDGKSEERVGKVLKARGGRKGLWLTTKVNKRQGDEAMRIIEASLKRLQVDQVDLLHMHSLADDADLAAAEAKGGVIETLYKVREQKLARFIGVTCHADPAVLLKAIEHNDFDCTQMALNASRQGQTKLGPGRSDEFEKAALAAALKKKMGVTAMKVFAQEKLNGAAPVEKLIRYTMSLPVASAMIGMPKLEMLEENVRIAKAFKPMTQSEMDGMYRAVGAQHKAAIDRHFADHVDG